MSIIHGYKQIYDLLESLKPLNFGRRFIFQKYLSNEISQNRIEKDDVKKLNDKFLTDTFLYGNHIRYFEGKKDKFNNLFSGVEGNYDQIYERYIEECKNNILEHEEDGVQNISFCVEISKSILFLFVAYKVTRIFS